MWIKRLSLFILCGCFLCGNFRTVYANTDSFDAKTVVHLTGEGIATRLHKPILEEFSDVDIKFIHIPEDSSVSPEDWLFLGTPVYKHKTNLDFCAKKYKKILCEKPVGLSSEEVYEIENAIKQNNVLFLVNYALRFLPNLEYIREFIRNNEVKSVTLTCNANFNQNPPNKAWKSDFKLGGGILYSILPHMIDLLNYLGFSDDLNSVSFKSSAEIPMNDIELYSDTKNGIHKKININLRNNFDELTLKIETKNDTKIFDLIDSSENKISGTKYINGTLSATSKISPWRISFRVLLENLFKNTNMPKFATLEDALEVHKTIDKIKELIMPCCFEQIQD